MENHPYHRLISEVIKDCGKKEVTDYMKKNYANIIESKRTFHSIKTFEQLIRILEKRDEINCFSVSILKNMFECLYNSKDCDESVKSCYELIINYCKLYKPEGPENVCTFCKAPSQVKVLQQIENTPEVNNGAVAASAPAMKFTENDDNAQEFLLDAISEIADDLTGDGWTKLARYINVKENKINQLKMRAAVFPHSEIVHEMFQEWIRANPEEATLHVLIDALSSKRIARKDLALRLKKMYNIK